MTRSACMRPIAVFAATMCLGSCLHAYIQDSEFTLRGELTSASPQPLSEYVIQFVDLRHAVNTLRTDVRSDGTFEVRNMVAGDYHAMITTLRGEMVSEQPVSVSPQSLLRIRLPQDDRQHPSGQTISARQLLHPPSKRAFKSFVEAQKFSSSGDYSKATAALERALQESPDYAEARVNLAVQYVRAGRLPEAAQELQTALQTGGPNGIALCNLAWVQMRLGDREHAIESARAGLKLAPALAAGHFTLGVLLAENPGTRAEGIVHLRKASDLPSARDLLVRLGVQ